MTKQEKLDKIYEIIMWLTNRKDFDDYWCMIGDCLEWSNSLPERESDYGLTQYEIDIVILWTSKTNPIQDQSDECIDYIYSLVN